MFKRTDILLVACFFGILTQDVYAYIDPSSITYFLQVFLALIVGALFTLRIRLASLYRSLFKKKEKTEEE